MRIEHHSRLAQSAARRVVLGLCLVWTLFQIYTASAIPFVLSDWFGLNIVFNNQEVRQIHLAFAMALAMLIHPLRAADHSSIPWVDWIAATIAAGCCLYLLVFKDQISGRSGLPVTADLWVSGIGLLMLGLALFRALGLPLLVVSSIFLLYVFFGDQPFLPDSMQWKGASLNKALWHFWMQTEGVFGVALGVASSMIFLFVLFGALLERAGAGLYFIQLAYSLLGHMRGGPAKAAVVASGLSGIYSGSSIANVVSTGTFTIPLMKQTGFTAEKAGAVEVAASTNGQLTPPVMGAAAFLIAEFTGVSYTDLIRHALLPALVSYIGLMYIVHLEAVKLGLQGMPRSSRALPWLQRYTSLLAGFFGVALLGGLIHLSFGWIKGVAPEFSIWLGLLVFVALYVFTLLLASRHPDVETLDSPESFQTVMPAHEILPRGLHFLVPIAVLLWCILIERLSPTLSAFWGTLAILTVILTQSALKQWFRGHAFQWALLRRGWDQAISGMIQGAQNMVGIGVATAVAGIIIGTVSLTGAHQVIGELVEALSGGSLIAMLVLVALMSLILGMGLPTTANYIVVSSLMAPVIVSLGAQSGLFVPLVAVHLFVFYFGILADDTPPVGLAAFAASAISQGDPIRTGIQGFTYDIRTAILPFLFIFNTELLLIDVTWVKGVTIFVVAAAAMMLFAAATQGFWLTRLRLWETGALLVIAFTLVRPGYWIDQIQPPWLPQSINETVLTEPTYAGTLQLVFEGPDFDDIDRDVRYVVLTTIPEGTDVTTFLESQGLIVQVDAETVSLEEPFPGTNYFQDLQRFDFYGDRPVALTALSVRNTAQWTKEWMYLPALLLLLIVLGSQRSRIAREVAHA